MNAIIKDYLLIYVIKVIVKHGNILNQSKALVLITILFNRKLEQTISTLKYEGSQD